MTEPVRTPGQWRHPYTPTLRGDLRWILDAVFAKAEGDVFAAAERLAQAYQAGTLARRLDYDPHETWYGCRVEPDHVILHRRGEWVAVDQTEPDRLRAELAFALIADYTGNAELAGDQAEAYAHETRALDQWWVTGAEVERFLARSRYGI